MSQPTNFAYLDDCIRPRLGKGLPLLMDYEDLVEWMEVLKGRDQAPEPAPKHVANQPFRVAPMPDPMGAGPGVWGAE